MLPNNKRKAVKDEEMFAGSISVLSTSSYSSQPCSNKLKPDKSNLRTPTPPSKAAPRKRTVFQSRQNRTVLQETGSGDVSQPPIRRRVKNRAVGSTRRRYLVSYIVLPRSVPSMHLRASFFFLTRSVISCFSALSGLDVAWKISKLATDQQVSKIRIFYFSGMRVEYWNGERRSGWICSFEIGFRNIHPQVRRYDLLHELLLVHVLLGILRLVKLLKRLLQLTFPLFANGTAMSITVQWWKEF